VFLMWWEVWQVLLIHTFIRWVSFNLSAMGEKRTFFDPRLRIIIGSRLSVEMISLGKELFVISSPDKIAIVGYCYRRLCVSSTEGR
jgi:hypothetical protein